MLSLPHLSNLLLTNAPTYSVVYDLRQDTTSHHKQILHARRLRSLVARLAALLRHHGVKPQDLVLISIDKSIDSLVLIFAIWSVSAVYVPIRDSEPTEGLGGSWLIARNPTSNYTADLSTSTQHPLYLRKLTTEPQCNLDSSVCAIFRTSGTTRPKGTSVFVRTACVLSTLDGMRKRLDVGCGRCSMMSIAALTFDPSLVELLLPVYTGSTLVIVPQSIVLTPRLVIDRVAEYGVCVFETTPWHLSLFTDAELRNLLVALDGAHLVVGGEQFPVYLRRLVGRGPVIWNVYGTTECSVWATMCRVRDTEKVPIGEPLEGVELCIRNDDGVVMGPGTGVLWIGGEDRRTAVTGDLEVMPKMRSTGDLCKRVINEDGTEEIFIEGRVDRLIKRFGVRVQLEAVERTVAEACSVTQCWAAMVDNELVAVLPGPTTVPTMLFGSTKIAPTLIPDFVFDYGRNLPSTVHGKVDGKQLTIWAKTALSKHHPQKGEMNSTAAATATTSKVKQTATNNILSMLAVDDSQGAEGFFVDLGGSSLLAQLAFNEIGVSLGLTPQQIRDNRAYFLICLMSHPLGNAVSMAVDQIMDRGAVRQQPPNTKRRRIEKDQDHKLHEFMQWLRGRKVRVSYSNSKASCGDFGANDKTSISALADLHKCIDSTPLVVWYCDDADRSEAVVYVGAHSGEFCAVWVGGAAELWRINLGSRIECNACVAELNGITTVAVGDYDGTVHLIDAIDGVRKGGFETSGMVKAAPTWCASLGVLFAASYDHFLYAAAIDGRVFAKTRLGAPVFASLVAVPCGDDDAASKRTVVAATLSGQVVKVSYSAKGGALEVNEIANVGAPVFSTPVLCADGNTLIVCAVNGHVYRVSVTESKVVWMKRCTQSTIFSTPVEYQTTTAKSVIFGTNGGEVISVSTDTGEVLWKVTADSAVYGSPSILKQREERLGSRGFAVVCTTKGTVYLVDAESGSIARKLAKEGDSEWFGGEVFSSLAVVGDGSFVVGCRDNVLYKVSVSASSKL